MFDRLPTPFGLVRYGVAPDHLKIKTVTRAYDAIAAHPRFRFFGNVDFGAHLTLADLQRHYHQVLFATGAQSDRRMGIPGEDLEGSHPATEFVAWYNGHPDYRDHPFDLSVERAAVVGVGNVAIDVARILVRTPEELAKTDIADVRARGAASQPHQGGVPAGPAWARAGGVHESGGEGDRRDGRRGRHRPARRSPTGSAEPGAGRRRTGSHTAEEGGDPAGVRAAHARRQEQAPARPVSRLARGADRRRTGPCHPHAPGAQHARGLGDGRPQCDGHRRARGSRRRPGVSLGGIPRASRCRVCRSTSAGA